MSTAIAGTPFKRVVYTESHDEVVNGQARVPEEIQLGDAESAFAEKRALLGIVLTLTAPGIPMLFQGQEFIEDEYFQDTEELDWDKQKRHRGIYHMVADLIKLRSGESEGGNGLRTQDITIVHFNPETKILVYKRGEGGESPVLVVLNFSNRDHGDYGIGMGEGANWQLCINSVAKEYDDNFSDLRSAAPIWRADLPTKDPIRERWRYRATRP